MQSFRRSRWCGSALAAVVYLALAGCSSGQTGSARTVRSIACPCTQVHSGDTLLRLQVVSAGPSQLEGTVLEVLAFSASEDGVIDVGERIAGSVVATLPCDQRVALDYAVGAELLVLYSAGITHLDGTFGFAIPWEGELVFGSDYRLPREEASVLFDLRACDERIPYQDEPLPPGSMSVSGGCSLGATPEAGAQWIALFLGLGGAIAWQRRRR